MRYSPTIREKGFYTSPKIKIISFFMILIFSICHSQNEVKGNTVFAPIGIINFAAEKQISNHLSLQIEAFVSPWKSFTGRHLQIYLGTAETRYYFTKKQNKWFLGAYISGGVFDIQKYNYWNDKHITNEEGVSLYNDDGTPRITSLYQRGFVYILGVDAGYKLKMSEHFNLEAFIGIGTVQGFYHGFFADTNLRYDKAEKWNKSGEILPTRGGVMISYVFK